MGLLGTKKKDGDLGLGTTDELWGGVSGLLEEGPKGKKRKRKKVKPVPPQARGYTHPPRDLPLRHRVIPRRHADRGM